MTRREHRISRTELGRLAEALSTEDGALDLPTQALVARVRSYGRTVPRDAAFTARLRSELLLAHRQRSRRSASQRGWLSRLPSLLLALLALASGLVAARVAPHPVGGGPRPIPLPRVLHIGPGPMALDQVTHHLFVEVWHSDKQGRLTGPTTVTMVDTDTGAFLHTVTLDPASYSLTVDSSAHRLFAVADYRLRVLDTQTGRLLSTARRTGGFERAFVDERAGHVFIYSGSAALFSRQELQMLDARTGRVLRSLAIPNNLDPRDKEGWAGRWLQAVAVDQRTSRAFLCLAARTESVVLVVDTRTGGIVRTLPTGEQSLSVAVDEVSNRVFLTGMKQDVTHYYFGDSTLAILDVATGATLQTMDMHRAILEPTQMAVDAGTHRVFIVSSGTFNRYEHIGRRGKVFVFDSASGALVRTLPVHTPVGILQLLAPFHRLAVGDAGPLDKTGAPLGALQLDVIDTRAGVVLRTASVSESPELVVIDAPSGHAFVLTGGRFDRQGHLIQQGAITMVDATQWP